MTRKSYSSAVSVILLAASCQLASAFQAKTVSASKSVDPARIHALLDLLPGLPVEYRADITFRILQQWPNSVAWRTQVQLLTDLFDDARQAKYSSAVVNADGNNGTVAHQQALDLGWSPLDTLDIQSRVISLLRDRAPAKSWNLLQEVSLPTRRAACKDSLTETFSSYYAVMMSSLQSVKGPTLPNGEIKAAYLADQAAHLIAPAQVQAFVDSLVIMGLPPQDLAPVVDQLVARLPLVEGSDREMYGAEEGKEQRLTSAIGRLVAKERQSGIDPTAFLLAYRAFLKRNLQLSGCADKSLDRQSEASAFNSLDPEHIGDPPKPVRSLSAEEIKPSSGGDSALSERIDSEAAIHPEGHRIALVFMANQKATHASDAPDDYLQPRPEDVDALLRYAVDDSRLETLSPLARYENQGATIELLITLLPPGPSFQDAVDAEMAWLNLNPVEDISPESWLRPFKTLLQISRPIDAEHLQAVKEAAMKRGGMIMMPNPQSSMIRETMRRYRSDRIISAYLTFEETFHPAYVTFEESRRHVPF